MKILNFCNFLMKWIKVSNCSDHFIELKIEKIKNLCWNQEEEILNYVEVDHCELIQQGIRDNFLGIR